MAREDITFEDIFYAIKRQANENEVEGVFRLHILRFWDNERIVKFCLHLLGFDSENGEKWLENQRTAAKTLEEYRTLHEGFMVALCQVLGLVYEEAITVDVVNAVKALKTERQWIPFSEKFPEARRVVLLSDGDDEYALGRWNEAVDRWDILFSDHQFRRDFFSHWMPLLKISHA